MKENRIRVNLLEVKEEQKSILRQLLELYEYDFSEYNDEDVNANGFFGYTYLDHYWTDEGRYPFFIMVENKYAGFVLVNSHSYLLDDREGKSIAEFFIMRKYRSKGIGREAATQIFDKFKGWWEVRQHGDNEPSKRFWQRVIDTYTAGQYKLMDVRTEKWVGQGYIFTNGGSHE
ncbi:GNAT family N-acetyltransferase [Paenibacillus sp. 1P07SE]|uniref:GNAT family N-acetyltransferase n=1 Tax=Paenibacillus sp. 1P07SE TaxID=3132209 RepID=UPI0039A64F5D